MVPVFLVGGDRAVVDRDITGKQRRTVVVRRVPGDRAVDDRAAPLPVICVNAATARREAAQEVARNRAIAGDGGFAHRQLAETVDTAAVGRLIVMDDGMDHFRVPIRQNSAAFAIHPVAVDLALLKNDVATTHSAPQTINTGGIGEHAAVRQPHETLCEHAAALRIGFLNSHALHGGAMMNLGPDEFDGAIGLDAAALGDLFYGKRLMTAVGDRETLDAQDSGTTMREHAAGPVAVDCQ